MTRNQDNGGVQTPDDRDSEPAAVQMPLALRVYAYLELLRLPNLFTAMADVAMGVFFVQAIVEPDVFLPAVIDSRDRVILGLLMASSSLLYAAGVVLNDLFDLPVDRVERPERALPSGRISLSAASSLGFGLLVAGVVVAGLVSLLQAQPRPVFVAILLAGGILLYDAWLKRTPLGPVGMGVCRMLNVLLGMSVMSTPWLLLGWPDAARRVPEWVVGVWPVPLAVPHWLVAGGMGVYVAGVTWLARSETARSNRLPLALATVVIAAGIGLMASFPLWTAYPAERLNQWYLIMAVFAVLICRRCVYAVIDPAPGRVQTAVKQCIMSIIILDAVITYAVAGQFWAVIVLLLLLPTVIFGQWIRST